VCFAIDTRITGYAAAAVLASVVANAPHVLAATTLSAEQQRETLNEHNRWRAAVGVPVLRWSDDLADSAQRWADNLRRSRNCLPAHSPDPARGENLYWAGALRWSDGRVETQAVSPMLVVGAWAEERNRYDPLAGACRPGAVCGHYTQLVWRRTTEVGCGMAVCPDLSQVWVCHYRPPGNYADQRAY
jgi:pathogenesis-related protein 1